MTSREILEEQLITNRLMQNSKETALFEEAMNELFKKESLDIIPVYIRAFDDNTEDSEIMFSMIHGIEAYDDIFGSINFMSALLQSVHLFREDATEWKEIIFIRILNNEKTRNILKSEIYQLCVTNRNIVIATLKSIKEQDVEKFGIFVDEILPV